MSEDVGESASQVSPSRPPRPHTSVRPPSTACMVGGGDKHAGGGGETRERACVQTRASDKRTKISTANQGKPNKYRRPTSPVEASTKTKSCGDHPPCVLVKKKAASFRSPPFRSFRTSLPHAFSFSPRGTASKQASRSFRKRFLNGDGILNRVEAVLKTASNV